MMEALIRTPIQHITNQSIRIILEFVVTKIEATHQGSRGYVPFKIQFGIIMKVLGSTILPWFLASRFVRHIFASATSYITASEFYAMSRRNAFNTGWKARMTKFLPITPHIIVWSLVGFIVGTTVAALGGFLLLRLLIHCAATG